MAPLLVLYGTGGGQTARIADRVSGAFAVARHRNPDGSRASGREVAA